MLVKSLVEDNYIQMMIQIRKLPQGKDIPAIALSAYTGEVNRQHSINAGYQRHVFKPVMITELIQTIDQLIAIKKQ